MKFTVEVKDFWLDEEELTETLQSYVKTEVVREIQASIKDKVEKQIAVKVKDVIDHKIALVIDSALTDLIAAETITYNRQEISIKQHVKNLFHSSTGWSNPNNQIANLAKEFGAEMKAQYNAVFANNVVQGMKEQGLLKDDVVQMLLSDKKTGV